MGKSEGEEGKGKGGRGEEGKRGKGRGGERSPIDSTEPESGLLAA
jgi:hypothetical protein